MIDFALFDNDLEVVFLVLLVVVIVLLLISLLVVHANLTTELTNKDVVTVVSQDWFTDQCISVLWFVIDRALAVSIAIILRMFHSLASAME